MKIFIITILISYTAIAQRQIKDLTAEAMEKRMVYEKWGEFRPNANRIFGIPTNPAYYEAWVFRADNRAYRRGPDIRPLKGTGLETQRNLKLLDINNRSDVIKEDSDELLQTNISESLHYTDTYVSIDPLFDFYYEDKLEPIINTSSLQTFKWQYKLQNIGFDDDGDLAIFPLLSDDLIDKFYDIHLRLKDKYEILNDQDMARGKRYLSYHDIMLELRDLQNLISIAKRNHLNRINLSEKLQNELNVNINVDESEDRERFIQMTLDNPNFY